MRIEANMISELDGKLVRLRWKNQKLIKRLAQTRDFLITEGNKIDKQVEAGKLSTENADKKRDEILAQFYHDQADIMFEFEGKTPDVEWFGREEFPVGQFEFLRQVFTNPQMQT